MTHGDFKDLRTFEPFFELGNHCFVAGVCPQRIHLATQSKRKTLTHPQHMEGVPEAQVRAPGCGEKYAGLVHLCQLLGDAKEN